jgi:hypothetical protein
MFFAQIKIRFNLKNPTMSFFKNIRKVGLKNVAFDTESVT